MNPAAWVLLRIVHMFYDNLLDLACNDGIAFSYDLLVSSEPMKQTVQTMLAQMVVVWQSLIKDLSMVVTSGISHS